MTPEAEILDDLLRQACRSRDGFIEAQNLLGALPLDLAAFNAMNAVARVASTAMIKDFEHLQEAMARLFRAVLRVLGASTKGLYPLDIGLRMVELRLLPDAERWVQMVKLRNELVHEYPNDPEHRLDRMTRVVAAFPELRETLGKIEIFVAEKGWRDD